MRIMKFTVGIRPSQKMFRVSSLHGSLVDSVLSLRGSNPIDDEYYTEISRGAEQAFIQLRNEDRGNTLRIDLDNFTFVKDFYASEKQFDIDDALKEFRLIWKQVNEVLHVRDIRRIGIVAEHRIPVEKNNPSAVLLKALTSVPVSAHPAKFILRFEERRVCQGPTGQADRWDLLSSWHGAALARGLPLSDELGALRQRHATRGVARGALRGTR